MSLLLVLDFSLIQRLFPQPEGAAVMVWIHGGAFVGGTAVVPLHHGQPLVAVGDVIVVSIQYRLNVFGYLTTGKGQTSVW